MIFTRIRTRIIKAEEAFFRSILFTITFCNRNFEDPMVVL